MATMRASITLTASDRVVSIRLYMRNKAHPMFRDNAHRELLGLVLTLVLTTDSQKTLRILVAYDSFSKPANC
ncbi:MAG: hypothetical protein FWD55_00350 [Propionibacteriaceae bacterium]|nr:hypothetical protein [Propionibacteriaceae bacterium]